VEIPSHNLGAVMTEWHTDETVCRLDTGFAEIDKVSGLHVGVTMIGGCSGAGKTTVLQAVTLAQAFPASARYEARDKPSERIVARTDDERPYVLFVSVEMPRRQLAARLASSLLVIAARDLMTDKRDALSHHKVDFTDFCSQLDVHGRFAVIDAESIGALTARALCDALEQWATGIRARDPQAKLVAGIDYLQFLEHGDATDDKARYEQVNEAMRAITNICREHQIFGLLGVQCADSQHPTIRADIRASKGVVDDAVAVWLIRRDKSNEAFLSLYCDKSRFGGEHWTVPLHMDGAHNMLTDAAPALRMGTTQTNSSPFTDV
jgi:replicative DNA helicase